MARSRWISINFYRKPLQLTIVVLLGYMVVRLFADPVYAPDFEAYCPFGGMQALASFSVSDTLACSMTSMQIAMGIALVLGAIVFSKLFCSFICPIGTFTEWLGRIGEKLNMRYTIRGFADRALRILKYALLFVTFYFTIEASELFCREWDPFYAAFTGFGHDVNVWYASIALGVVVLGSVFIRQFWCKYLCPLSAATNIFAVIYIPLTVLGIYLLLGSLGAVIGWMYPLAATSLLGFAWEAWKMKTMGVPLTVIQRIDSVCTGCRKCDKACPMAIEVSTADKVRDIDCHLCTDCIQACPEKGALTINKKNIQWFPAIAAIGLIAGGFLFGTNVQIPTITERWGTEEAFARAKVFEQSGLRSIKCFGSSSSFASQMRGVEGVLGVQTFVGSRSVKVWYDPAIIDARGVHEAMFAAKRIRFAEPETGSVQIGVVTIGVDKLFDSYDYYDFEQLLLQHRGIYTADSKFGEPVEVTFYFNPLVTSPDKIAAWIKSPSVTYTQNGTKVTQEVNFGASILSPATTTTVLDYHKALFDAEDWKFNGFDENAEYATYEIPVPQILERRFAEQLPFLISHVSNDTGTVRFVTSFAGEKPVAHILYKTDITSPEKIHRALIAPRLRVMYDDGSEEFVDNPFVFIKPGSPAGPTMKKEK